MKSQYNYKKSEDCDWEKTKEWQEAYDSYKEKDKENKEYAKSKTPKFLYTTLLSANKCQLREDFNMIGNLLSNQNKINKLLSMSEDRCYEIESSNGTSIAIISKNNILNVTPVNNVNECFNMIIENVKTKAHLDFIAEHFQNPFIISAINKLIDASSGHYFAHTCKARNVSMYSFKRGDYYVFTTIDPNAS